MINTIYSITALLVFISCQQNNSDKINAKLLQELQQQEVTVVDIRTIGEYKRGHIAGVSNNIDFLKPDFLEKMDAFDKSEPIVIYCQVGGRSARAATLLKKNGFDKVYDYGVGFSDWQKNGLPIDR